MTVNNPYSPPDGIHVDDVVPKPDPIRQAFGWLVIAVSPVPFGIPVVGIIRTWDRIGQANTALWVLPLVMLCYAAYSAALLCGGIGLVSGRDKLVWIGVWLFSGTLLPFLILFAVFD